MIIGEIIFDYFLVQVLLLNYVDDYLYLIKINPECTLSIVPHLTALSFFLFCHVFLDPTERLLVLLFHLTLYPCVQDRNV